MNYQWLQIRVQAIRGLPLLCKDNSEYVSKIVDVLGQLLIYGTSFCLTCFLQFFCSGHIFVCLLFLWSLFLEENVERDAVHKALMSLLRQDVKGSVHQLITFVIY